MATASASAPPKAISAPRYVGASTAIVSPGSINAWHISAMHSIPPLVTIRSAGSGRRPCSCSWRSIRYSRTLAIPAHGVYCSATAASSRTSRAAISSTSSVGNVAGFGKPPVIESTPGGLPARIALTSAPPRSRVRRANACAKSGIDGERQRARLAAVERGDVLGVVREVVERGAARLGGEDGALAAGDLLRAVERGRDPLRAGDEQPVVVPEDELARCDVDPAERDGPAVRGAR